MCRNVTFLILIRNYVKITPKELKTPMEVVGFFLILYCRILVEQRYSAEENDVVTVRGIALG